MASVTGLLDALGPGFREGKQTYLSYLPSANILELCNQLAHLGLNNLTHSLMPHVDRRFHGQMHNLPGYGSEVGFSDTLCLSSLGAVRVKPSGELCSDELDPDYAPGALGAFKPTHFAGIACYLSFYGLSLILARVCGCVYFFVMPIQRTKHSALPMIWDTFKRAAEAQMGELNPIHKVINRRADMHAIK